MKKLLLILGLIIISVLAQAQYLGDIVSVMPDSVSPGDTLTTTITLPIVNWAEASPPCDNHGVYLLQNTDTIFCTSYYPSGNGPYKIVADFQIPAAAPSGFYSVYVWGATYDWFNTMNCIDLGYYQYINGLEVTGTTGISDQEVQMSPFVYTDPDLHRPVIRINNREGKKYYLTVFNIDGSEIFTEVFSSERCSINDIRMIPGVYFYRLEDLENNFIYHGKFFYRE